MKKILNKRYVKNSLLIISLLLYILCICPVALQNDIFYDIKVGEKYFTEGINTIENLSIHENLKYVSHHFLVTILHYIIHYFAGFNGIYILEMVLTCILALLFYTANKIYISNKKLSYIFVFIELFFMIGYISTRAQMFSYILFLLEFICIEKFLRTSKKKHLVILSIVPLLLINFHAGTIPIYFIIISVYLLNYFNINIVRLENEKEFKKNLKYLFIPIISGLVLMFINPFGFDGIIYGFKTYGNSFINDYILEFQNSSIGNNLYFFIYLIILLLSYVFTKQKIKTHQLLFLLGSTVMSLVALRHFSLFVIMNIVNLCFLEEILTNIYIWFYNDSKNIDKQKLIFKVLSYTVFGITIFMICFSNILFRKNKFLPNTDYPISAIEYISENIDKDKRIFNKYDWGSLLIYNGIKPFIDSRCDLYTPEYNNGCEVANDYVKLIKLTCNPDEIFEKYNIDYILINKTTPLYTFLDNNKKYIKVFNDDTSSIFLIDKNT